MALVRYFVAHGFQFFENLQVEIPEARCRECGMGTHPHHPVCVSRAILLANLRPVAPRELATTTPLYLLLLVACKQSPQYHR
jgi:hypothetical protein